MISFAYEDTDFRLDNEGDLAQWLILVIRQHGRQTEAVTYVLCSDAYLLYLNRTYLKHDYYTDILTFNYTEGDDRPLTADLFISVDTVRDNAAEYGATFVDELHRVMAHGALHLVGFDDHTEAQQRDMRHQEEVALHLRMF